MTKPLLRIVIGALAACQLAAASAPAGVKDWNVLFISVDTLRADHLSCYGCPNRTSPRIDALARAGARFDAAYSTRGLTGPSLTSIMTSLHPIDHGVRENGFVYGDYKATLATALKSAGYATAVFSANPHCTPVPGFDEVYSLDDAQVERDVEAAKASAPKAGGRMDRVVTDKAIDWFGRNAGRKSFVWVHYISPHRPYDPPAAYRALFDPDYAGAYDGSQKTLDEISAKKIELDPRDLRHILALYDGSVRYVDDLVGELLDALEQRGLLERTLIVVTSDHGEELYQHQQYFYHTSSIYGAVLRIPFIVRAPSGFPAGLVVDGIVESVDFAPTVLDVLGLAAPPEFRGLSLKPWLAGRGGAIRPSAMGELFFYPKQRAYTIFTGDYRYIDNPDRVRRATFPGATLETFVVGERELYSERGDPLEQVNIAEKEPATAGRLRRELRKRLAEHPVERVLDQHLSNTSLEKLRELGYVR